MEFIWNSSPILLSLLVYCLKHGATRKRIIIIRWYYFYGDLLKIYSIYLRSFIYRHFLSLINDTSILNNFTHTKTKRRKYSFSKLYLKKKKSFILAPFHDNLSRKLDFRNSKHKGGSGGGAHGSAETIHLVLENSEARRKVSNKQAIDGIRWFSSENRLATFTNRWIDR